MQIGLVFSIEEVQELLVCIAAAKFEAKGDGLTDQVEKKLEAAHKSMSIALEKESKR